MTSPKNRARLRKVRDPATPGAPKKKHSKEEDEVLRSPRNIGPQVDVTSAAIIALTLVDELPHAKVEVASRQLESALRNYRFRATAEVEKAAKESTCYGQLKEEWSTQQIIELMVERKVFLKKKDLKAAANWKPIFHLFLDEQAESLRSGKLTLRLNETQKKTRQMRRLLSLHLPGFVRSEIPPLPALGPQNGWWKYWKTLFWNGGFGGTIIFGNTHYSYNRLSYEKDPALLSIGHPGWLMTGSLFHGLL